MNWLENWSSMNFLVSILSGLRAPFAGVDKKYFAVCARWTRSYISLYAFVNNFMLLIWRCEHLSLKATKPASSGGYFFGAATRLRVSDFHKRIALAYFKWWYSTLCSTLCRPWCIFTVENLLIHISSNAPLCIMYRHIRS